MNRYVNISLAFGMSAFLGAAASRFPDVRVLDVGGGLGVPERPGQSPLDLADLLQIARFASRIASDNVWGSAALISLRLSWITSTAVAEATSPAA